ncbi:MAG: 3-hydroxyacyl-CoA dehydrogenase [Syntrophobacteraceae bacterium]
MATIYLREFPEELHHQAKIQAAVEKLHLKDLFAKALTEYLRKAGVPEMDADQRKEG